MTEQKPQAIRPTDYESEEIGKVPAVYADQVFVSMDSAGVRITFTEKVEGKVRARSAVRLPPAAIAMLGDLLNKAAEEFARMMLEQRALERMAAMSALVGQPVRRPGT